MKFKIGTLVNLNTQEYTASAAGRLAAMEKIAAIERMQEPVKENIMKIMHRNCEKQFQSTLQPFLAKFIPSPGPLETRAW